LLREPYLDDPQNKGVIVVDDEPLAAFFKAADKYGVQVLCHCIGDGAIENVLGHIEAVMHDGKNPLRHGIVHCQIMDQEMMERLKKDEVLVLAQPIFLHSDMHALPTRIPEELARTSNAYRTLMKMGIPQSFGTDCPVEGLDPMAGICCAVTRRDFEGRGPFLPEQALSVQEAIYGYTAAGAYASMDEHRKGKIAPGMLADFVVLQKSPFAVPADEIANIAIEATVLGGKTVYER
jgi:predicted amidohydrolase YtcJ